MTSPARFAELTSGLIEGVRTHAALIGLALLGSASEEGRARRDEWSDHDFFAVAAPGAGPAARTDLAWLPYSDALVLTAREGDIGYVALYDDGHVLEFALAEAAELSGALAGAASVVVDDESGATANLIAQSRARAVSADGHDPENDIRLVLVKLLIGVGRLRRGERLVANTFIRTWAVQHLVRAIRGRSADLSTSARDEIDPLRRFEVDFPEWAARVGDALDLEAEAAAHSLFTFARGVLEPGWAEFPSAAADAVALRLGWEESGD